MLISSRFVKISGILLAALAAIITSIALFLPYLLDVNAYRAEITNALQQSLNRPVNFGSGSFAWNFGPSFVFKSFSVRERDNGSDFISSGTISVQLALLPLLEKRVEFKSLVLDDTVISISRNKNGSYNIDDLLKSGDGSVRINFNKIKMHNGSVRWSDRAGNSEPFSAELHNVSISADRIEGGQKGHLKFSCNIPGANGTLAQVAVNAGLRLPEEGKSLLETYVDGDLTLKQLEIGMFWRYFGQFVPFVNTGGRLDFNTSFKGKIEDFNAKGKVVVHNATVNWPTIFHAPLSPKTLKLEYVMTLDKSRIDITTVDLGMEGFRIKGSCKLLDYRTSDPRIIAKAATPSVFSYEDVRNFVPYGIIESGTSDYIENKIKAGIFKLDIGTLDGRISQIAHMEKDQNWNTLLIRGTVEKAILSYGKVSPAFNDIRGTVELKGKNFNLIGMSGNFGTSPFTLNGSITEYNTDKNSEYPVTMDISPHSPEIAWLAKLAGIPKLEYGSSSSLRLNGCGQYSAYRLSGDWDLKQASYNLPGYVSKSYSVPNTLKFSTVIGSETTKVTNVNYNLQPLTVTGSGLIGYGGKPYLGFDLQTNRFAINESLPILSMWQRYRIHGLVQAHIRGGGNPVDMSAIDYFGNVNVAKLSFLPDDQLKTISGINGDIVFKGNSLETSTLSAQYGKSAITGRVAIKSFRKPAGDITISSPQLFLNDLYVINGSSDANIRRFGANFVLNGNSIVFNSVSGMLNSSNFNLSGIYNTGRSKQASIAVTSSKLDLDDLRQLLPPQQKNDSQKSPGIDLKFSLNADSGVFGNLTFTKLNATAQQESGVIYLQNLTTGVYGGKLTAKGRIAPGGENGHRYDLSFEISKADAEKLFIALELTREITGTMTLSGDLTARGNNLLEIKKSALGNVRLNLSSGTLRRFNSLAKVFSILNVSQLLKFKLPDMVSGGMPYSSIKGSFSVKDGTTSTKDLFISSNAINISIIGSADVVKEELNLTIGAQPLQTVDKIVNKIPIVGWLLTGRDKDLLTAYFEAKGRWDNPQVSAIPVKSMGKGIMNIFIRAFELPVKLFTDTGEVILGK